MFELLRNIEPGSWPNWVSAVVTSFAFVVAAVSYRRSVTVRREEQARLVYSKLLDLEFFDAGVEFEMQAHGAHQGVKAPGIDITKPSSPGEKSRYVAPVPAIRLTAAIHNGSKELIGPAKLQVVNTGRKITLDAFCVMTAVIDPSSDYIVDFVWPNEDYPGQPNLGTTLIFRDAGRRWWRRHLSEPIEAVHDDPENAAYTPIQRGQYAANARAMGLTPSPEPAVPLLVQWRRLWRKLRGKSPIP